MMMFMCIFRKVHIDGKIFLCIRPFENKHNAFFKMTSITINSDVAGRIESITQRPQSTLMTKPFIYCLPSTSNLLKCTVDFRDLFSTFDIFFHWVSISTHKVDTHKSCQFRISLWGYTNPIL